MCGISFFAGKNHEQLCKKYGPRINPRGPDETKTLVREKYSMHFSRLHIVGSNENSMQPFSSEMKESTVDTMCNGEIYNFKDVLSLTSDKTHPEYYYYRLEMSDCEVIHQAYVSNHQSVVPSKLDGVFAYISVSDNILHAARDPIGVRPLFIGYRDGVLGLASEVKVLEALWPNVKPFPPGHKLSISLNDLDNMTWTPYSSPWTTVPLSYSKGRKAAQQEIVNRLTLSVKKRLMSDRPIAALLSGGLDSSLICGLLSKLTKEKLHTFSIGLKGSPDLEYAQKVANHLNTHHHSVEVEAKDFVSAVPEVIKLLETCDVTTIRASVPMYLLCKYISEKTDFKVIFSGEGSDEVSQGYLYFHRRPSVHEADRESRRLIQDLHYFDVLRADRCTAGQGLELRVPFLDRSFVEYYLSLPSEWRCVNDKKIEKFLLREAFSVCESGLIPDEVLWRKKDGFSDGVTAMKAKPWFETLGVWPSEFDDKIETPSTLPNTPEALYYYTLFRQMYPGLDHLHPYTWMAKWGDGVISGRKI